MKTAEVRILPALTTDESSAEDSFLLVETTSSSQGEETSINHIRRGASSDADGLTMESVATSLTSTHKVALDWAAAFAALNEIPVVYERREDGLEVGADSSTGLRKTE